jgi:hypothetical protein
MFLGDPETSQTKSTIIAKSGLSVVQYEVGSRQLLARGSKVSVRRWQSTYKGYPLESLQRVAAVVQQECETRSQTQPTMSRKAIYVILLPLNHSQTSDAPSDTPAQL